MGERQGLFEVQEHEFRAGDRSIEGEQLFDKVGGLRYVRGVRFVHCFSPSARI